MNLGQILLQKGSEMKKLTKNIRCEELHNIRSKKVSLQWDMVKTGNDNMSYNHTFQTQHEYRLSLVLSTNIWCNPAQLNHARQAAEDLIVHDLFNDSLLYIKQCRLAIMENSWEDARRALDKIEKEILE